MTLGLGTTKNTVNAVSVKLSFLLYINARRLGVVPTGSSNTRKPSLLFSIDPDSRDEVELGVVFNYDTSTSMPRTD